MADAAGRSLIHDWSSHTADVSRELAVNLYDVKSKSRRQQVAQIDYDVFNHHEETYRSQHFVTDYDPFALPDNDYNPYT